MALVRFVGIGGAAGFAAGATIALACSSNASSSMEKCQELDSEYTRQLEVARICSPDVSAAQCSLEMNDQLFCPCPRFVNPANQSAVAHLSQLKAEWEASSCPPATPQCDASACPVADAALCGPQPQGPSAPGLCQDQH